MYSDIKLFMGVFVSIQQLMKYVCDFNQNVKKGFLTPLLFLPPLPTPKASHWKGHMQEGQSNEKKRQ